MADSMTRLKRGGMSMESRTDTFMEFVKEGKIIEFGCGGGALLEQLHCQFPTSLIVGVDVSWEALNSANEKALDNVIIANAVNMGGHVEIDSHATVGGLTAIHQFVKIGQYAFVGGGLRINKDIPPYIRVAGDPARYAGTNFVGLERKGFSKEVILELKRAYRYIYQSSDTVAEASEKIKTELKSHPEIQQVLEFLKRSERGIIRGQD